MQKKTIAAAAGLAALSLAAATLLGAPAQAAYGAHHIETVVTWRGGDNWLAVDYPGDGVVLEGTGYRSVNHDFTAYPGNRIGADPIMGDASYISCTLYINGRVEYFDDAYAGDGTDANCIQYLHT